ncbi:MAG: NDP-sugar synthase [Acidimicrobiia bacterium]
MTIHQAVLLVGGRGTRMWPLTATVPKGLIPVAGVPFLDLQIRQLVAAGIDEVFLAVGRAQLEAWQQFAADRDGVRLVVEDEPLDTAGPVLAALNDLAERFLVLNGDVVIEADLKSYLGAADDDVKATLGLIEVEDTSAYGVVVLDTDGMVDRFIEKPPADQAPAQTVNAGIYVMTRTALADYGEGSLSFEQVVFPSLAAEGSLQGVVIEGRWLDIGTPELFLDCTGAVLGGATELHRPASSHLIEGTCRGNTAGEWSWIAPGATVESGAVVEESVILPGATVGANSVIRRGIVGWDAAIGNDSVVTGATMIGAGASIGSNVELDRGIRIAPGSHLDSGAVTFSPPS